MAIRSSSSITSQSHKGLFTVLFRRRGRDHHLLITLMRTSWWGSALFPPPPFVKNKGWNPRGIVFAKNNAQGGTRGINNTNNNNICRRNYHLGKGNNVSLLQGWNNKVPGIYGGPPGGVSAHLPTMNLSMRFIHRTAATTGSPAQQKDYYGILGVSKAATSRDIKKAYYELAKKVHPDTSKGRAAGAEEAQKRFQEVSEAYEVLSDDNKRREYDAWGQTSEQMGRAGGGSSGDGGARSRAGGFRQSSWNFHSSIDPEELFRKIFGGGGGRGGFKWNPFGFGSNHHEDFQEASFGRKASQEIVINLTFPEAARGGHKELMLHVTDTCSKCSGTKCEPGTKPGKCRQCNGIGYEIISSSNFVQWSTCRGCRGARFVNQSPCGGCNGMGVTTQRKKVTVPVPPGVVDSQIVRMPLGSQELFITFRVEKSDYFQRDGSDVLSQAGISISQAILGGSTKVQGLYDENLTVEVPPGTGSHAKIIVRGKGFRKASGIGYGDHLIQVKVQVPTVLSARQKALVELFAELDDETDTTRGSINGLTRTTGGKNKLTSDDSDLVKRLKRALNPGDGESVPDDKNDKSI